MLLIAPGPVTRAADTVPYEVSLGATGEATLDQALHDASSLISLAAAAPVGPFALVVRARDDRARFAAALHSFGYYQGKVDLTIDGRPLDDPTLIEALRAAPAAPPARVAASFALGRLFRLGAVGVTGRLPTGMAVGLRPGAPARAADILAAGDHLLAALRQAGYALATVAPPVATVSPEHGTLDVAYAVDTGPRVDLGAITISGLKHVHAAYVRDRLTLRPGQLFNVTAIEAARADLAGLGVFSEVRAEPATQLRCRGPAAADLRGDRTTAAIGRSRPVLCDRHGAEPVGRLAPPQPVRQCGAAQPDGQRLGRRRCGHRPRLQARRAVHQAGLPDARAVAVGRDRRLAPGPASV